MSMNGFFQAFTQQEIDALKIDNSLIDHWVWGDKKYAAETDVESAWDVLASILAGVGFFVGEQVENALSNGCALISSIEVNDHAQKLSNWSHEKILERLKHLNEDLYHFEFYQDDEQSLLEQFDKLAAFYKHAAEKQWGAVFYIA